MKCDSNPHESWHYDPYPNTTPLSISAQKSFPLLNEQQRFITRGPYGLFSSHIWLENQGPETSADFSIVTQIAFS